ncbi:hypothetical protein [Novosphingobium rosa]|uniref:hypothetical protein n=1 Tax=Novosphingobium rosa TaxID=76978 RepID=UPI000A8E942B|nr:hypothetical protein [Novosphingobium rosa]
MPDTSPSLFGGKPPESSDKLLEQTGWGKDIRDFYNAAVDEGVPPEFENLMAKIAKKIK